MDRGALLATVCGVTKSRTRLHFHFHQVILKHHHLGMIDLKELPTQPTKAGLMQSRCVCFRAEPRSQLEKLVSTRRLLGSEPSCTVGGFGQAEPRGAASGDGLGFGENGFTTH